ncbi:heterokaryon incompatibility protein-domain-containing protein [Cercophora newfieldiana]|uniref:Heterokaryon incompatibility protein-domain-containing protein n=1 Tax=Cercophora newfieldiana TaxID=92897 RepID=A0AA39YGD7_9PEZI|nr:heterokaryon incompatibility protein-domain-containing protein [Cercophora newfieldiana]
MWLIDVDTLKLLPVPDAGKNRYAILSHTWDATETSFQDIQDIDQAQSKPSFQKIAKTCDIARSKKLKYAWIDTCCIDKTSSAELSEAINSMFEWYKRSYVCYVYLSDFKPLPGKLSEKERRSLVNDQLHKCRWFTRGWTLQELVAPKKLEFFDRDWNFVGGREDLEDTLFEITGIDGDVLRDSSGLASIPVGRRMSWAVGRKTTRIEDRAYSLLGIFNIHMPLLYGEGERAFFRLQQEIASQSNDLSLFAWQYETTDDVDPPMFSGVFSDSPDSFWPCSTIKKHGDYFSSTAEFAITNKGLRIDGGLLSVDKSSMAPQFLLDLDCVRAVEEDEEDEGSSNEAHCNLNLDWLDDDNRDDVVAKWVAIRLRKVGDTFVRHMPATMATARTRSEWALMRSIEGVGKSDPVYIQTYMRHDEVLRVRSLMDTGVVLVYNEYFSANMSNHWGLPDDPELSNGEDSERRLFTFPSNLVDNFLCVHVFQLGSASFAVISMLQWTGTKCELRVGAFKSESILPHRGERPDTPAKRQEELRAVKDMLLVSCSDGSGHLDQEMMPISAEGSGEELNANFRVKPLRRLEKNPLASVFTWKENYHHVEIIGGIERL